MLSLNVPIVWVNVTPPSAIFPMVKVQPRPIIAKFLSWKDKEKIVKAARKIKPKQVQFLEDESKNTG